jgi:lysophospholipase L1-like esterase
MKCGLISLVIVLSSLSILDRIVLPTLERQGLTAGDDWARHNAIVIKEHQRSDETIAFPETPAALIPAGVRTWAGHPVAPEKPAGMRRILVMGDSFVWGSAYLTLNHMWWRQLGQLLEPKSVEVIALGRPGASTRDQLQWAKHFVPQYQPDLIIWGYVTNDADEGLIRQIDTSQQSIPKLDRVRYLARNLWPRMMGKFDALRSNKLSAMYTGPEYGYEYSEWEMKLVEPDNLAAYAKTVRAVKAFLDEVQIPGFMMTLPNFPSSAAFNSRFTPILKVWSEAGIAAFDTIPEFVRRYGETPLSGHESVQWGINPADGHPGPRSCRFLAEQAAEIVQRDYTQVLGQSSTGPFSAIINDWLPYLDRKSQPRPDPDGIAWKMVYPADESRYPTMPLGHPTPILAFRNPVSLNSIELSGPSLKSARLWVSFLDEKEHYDDGVLHELNEKSGTEIRWDLPADLADRQMTVIRFQATFISSNRELVWKFPPKATVGQ